jgi:hypothetical protein
MKAFFGKGKKASDTQKRQEEDQKPPESDTHNKDEDQKHHSIKVNRSDGKAHDLNAILASTDLSGVIIEATADKPKTEKQEHDHGKIAISRSDGVNHCIINVFKGLSDATGETMRRTSGTGETFRRTSGTGDNIHCSHALSMSAISARRTSGLLFPLSVRIVHMSDTFNFLSASTTNSFLPAGDILVHSGDFTQYGATKEFEQFNTWLGSVATQYRYRIVTLGCRDVKEFGNNWDVMRRLLSNATHVLCHETAVVLGIRFYGCPWHWGHHKNYLVRKGAPSSTTGRFDEIPESTQVLITHGAAAGVLDSATLPGSKELVDGIRRAKPALHLHGHSRGSHGVVPAFARYPLVVNSALCDPDARVLYACPHVIKATQISPMEDCAGGAMGSASWNFAIDSLMP